MTVIIRSARVVPARKGIHIWDKLSNAFSRRMIEDPDHAENDDEQSQHPQHTDDGDRVQDGRMFRENEQVQESRTMPAL
jgi:hypothetical protein